MKKKMKKKNITVTLIPSWKGNFEPLPPGRKKLIAVTGAKCMDCNGRVALFGVVDKVWDGLGLPLDAWICLRCFAVRLNPKNPWLRVRPFTSYLTRFEMTKEIVRQKRRFKLKKINFYNGSAPLPLWSSLIVGMEQGGVRFMSGWAGTVSLPLPPGEVTAKKCGPCER